jgi:hypothetical protein
MIDVSNKQDFIDIINNNLKPITEATSYSSKLSKAWNIDAENLIDICPNYYNGLIDEYAKYLSDIIDRTFIETWIIFIGANSAKDIYDYLTSDFTIEKCNKINSCIEAVNDQLSNAYDYQYQLGEFSSPVPKSEETLHKLEESWNKVFPLKEFPAL